MIVRHFKRLLREKSLHCNQWLPKFSTAIVLEPENAHKKNTHKDRMDNFFNENPEYKKIKALIPSKLLRRNLTTPVEMYLIDKSIAKTIAYQIKESCKLKSLVIIEINPGLGLLTEELLSLGVKQIEMMESKPKFYEYLSEKFKNRGVNLQNIDFLNIWSLMYQDRFDNGNRFVELMKNIQPKPWSSDSPMKIIGTIPQTSFIRQLIYTTIYQMGLPSYGRPELLVTIPPSVFYSITAMPESGYIAYRSSSVLFQLLFDIKLLTKLPRNAFLPWQKQFANSTKRKRNTASIEIDEDFLYLVHIVGKKNLPVPNEQLQLLHYFVKHHLLTRKSRVIPHMERWIPGSGKKFIAASARSKEKRDTFKDIGIFTQFGELQPLQILHLFKHFITLPEFPECPFTASMESSILKIESSEEETAELQKRELEPFAQDEEHIEPEKQT